MREVNGLKASESRKFKRVAPSGPDTWLTPRRTGGSAAPEYAGKSYIANALASDACRKLHKTLYCRMFELISDIKHMETQRLKRRYVNPDVLVIDAFANTKMTEEDALQIFKVMEYRYGFKSTIIASQVEPTEWQRNFGASQLADSILDRIVSNAYKIILSGDSLRPKKIED